MNGTSSKGFNGRARKTRVARKRYSAEYQRGARPTRANVGIAVGPAEPSVQTPPPKMQLRSIYHLQWDNKTTFLRAAFHGEESSPSFQSNDDKCAHTHMLNCAPGHKRACVERSMSRIRDDHPCIRQVSSRLQQRPFKTKCRACSSQWNLNVRGAGLKAEMRSCI